MSRRLSVSSIAATTAGDAETASTDRPERSTELISAGKTERTRANSATRPFFTTKTFWTSPGRGPRLGGAGDVAGAEDLASTAGCCAIAGAPNSHGATVMSDTT